MNMISYMYQILWFSGFHRAKSDPRPSLLVGFSASSNHCILRHGGK